MVETCTVKAGFIAAIYADSRDVLVEFVRKSMAAHEGPIDQALVVSFEGEGCFTHYKAYSTIADIPEASDPCTCGDPTHWFIKYRD